MIETYELIPHLKIEEESDSALCLGFFDGLHVGHRKLIQEALSEHSRVSVLTFTGPLKALTHQHAEDAVLTPLKEKEELLDEMGVKRLFVLPFNETIRDMDPVRFIEDYLLPLKIRNIYIGMDFRFGKEAKGDSALLKKYFNVTIVPFAMIDPTHKVSTTTIISLLKEGKVGEANRLLGRTYRLEGKVVKGLHNGTSIGFPTANISAPENVVVPKNGVYATKVLFRNRMYLSMTNIGTHPTIDPLNRPVIETNLFDYEGNLYDDEIYLYFLSYLREETKFDSLEELKNQLRKDEKYVREHYSV